MSESSNSSNGEQEQAARRQAAPRLPPSPPRAASFSHYEAYLALVEQNFHGQSPETFNVIILESIRTIGFIQLATFKPDQFSLEHWNGDLNIDFETRFGKDSLAITPHIWHRDRRSPSSIPIIRRIQTYFVDLHRCALQSVENDNDDPILVSRLELFFFLSLILDARRDDTINFWKNSVFKRWDFLKRRRLDDYEKYFYTYRGDGGPSSRDDNDHDHDQRYENEIYQTEFAQNILVHVNRYDFFHSSIGRQHRGKILQKRTEYIRAERETFQQKLREHFGGNTKLIIPTYDEIVNGNLIKINEKLTKEQEEQFLSNDDDDDPYWLSYLSHYEDDEDENRFDNPPEMRTGKETFIFFIIEYFDRLMEYYRTYIDQRTQMHSYLRIIHFAFSLLIDGGGDHQCLDQFLCNLKNQEIFPFSRITTLFITMLFLFRIEDFRILFNLLRTELPSVYKIYLKQIIDPLERRWYEDDRNLHFNYDDRLDSTKPNYISYFRSYFAQNTFTPFSEYSTALNNISNMNLKFDTMAGLIVEETNRQTPQNLCAINSMNDPLIGSINNLEKNILFRYISINQENDWHCTENNVLEHKLQMIGNIKTFSIRNELDKFDWEKMEKEFFNDF